MTDATTYQALFELSRALHTLDTSEVMQTLVTRTSTLVRATDGCIVTLGDDQSIEAAYALNADTRAEMWEGLVERGMIGFVVHGARVVTIRDLNNDPRWANVPGLPQQGSAIGVPLMDDQQRVVSVLLLLHNRVDYFGERAVNLLERAAEVAVPALLNALRHEREATGNPFENAIVPVILTDLDGTIRAINTEAHTFLGFTPEELVGKPITQIHRAGADVFTDGQLTELAPGGRLSFRAIVSNASGEFVPVVVRARRRTWQGREVIELVEQDITAEVQVEQLRRDLAAMVYHDLRGPLTTIKGSMQKLGQILVNTDDTTVLSLLQTGIRSSRQLRRMIDSLLDIQRLEDGSKMLNSRSVELRALLADAVQLVQPVAMEAGLSLKYKIDSDLPAITIDEDMIVRVVTNLLENAIKYTPAGGRIILRAQVVKDMIEIGVQDNGPGIPTHMRQAIFDKFSRVKYRDAPKGIGLGLAFCKLAVEAHGGDIWVDSIDGNGSEFVFTLPLVHTSDGAEEGTPSRAAVP